MRLGVAALVLADAAARLVGEVEAHLAQADALLDLADGVGQRVGVLGVAAQDVEGQALGGALADAGQLAELGDEPLDGRRIQALEARQAQRAQVHAAGEAAEPGLLQLLGGAQRLVGGGEDHVLQQLGVVGVDRLGSRS